MLAGGAVLALLIAGWCSVRWYRSTAPSPVIVTQAAAADPRAMASLPGPAAARAAPPARPAQSEGSPPGTSAAAPEATGEIVVHVVGAVRKPGVVRLPAKARLTEALRAAGGAKAGADLEAVNLASFVQDGEQIRVPSLTERRLARAATAAALRPARPPRGPAPLRPVRTTARYPLAVSTAASKAVGPSSAASEAPAEGPVNINTAGPEELDTLPGVGPSTAAAILEFRREHGPFQSVEDLLQVRGIGEKKLAAMRDRVVIR
jgi:competence protein ComEA